ncbi:type II toxin-antitoxin system VapC family toxin [Methylocystis sp.]|uniref:type II toxin-antitoxin system VapC family toxin n=1 Tax=Methylocystis sp. TaxID=1911079 RepID=UPI003D121F6D
MACRSDLAEMIIDASALIAILRAEPEALAFAKEIATAKTPRISAASYVEAAAVIDSAGDAVASARLDELLNEAGVVIEPVTAEQARLARAAYRDFGKGRGHRAKLNFGDCFSYALAKAYREPLLYKGDDFTHTDVRSAL